MNKLFTIILLLVNISLFAQSNCERNLQDAKSDYNTGNLYAIPGKVTDCLEEGFTKEEKIDAYRLLTLTYLNINQNEKAKESLIKLLNIKTDYRALPNIDPPELYSLYQKIDTDPKYFIGAIVGGNFNTIQIVEEFTNESLPGSNALRYNGKMSYQVGGQFILPLLKNFWLKGELLYQVQRYGFDLTNTIRENGKSTNYTYTSNNNGINLNLSARSTINNYYWKPFVEYGITGRYNINHQFFDYRSRNIDPEGTVEVLLVDPINMQEFRKQFNVGFHLHIGTMRKIGENYLEIKLGASKFLLPYADYIDKTQRQLSTIGAQGEVIDSDYNNLIYQMSLSFNIPFFNFK